MIVGEYLHYNVSFWGQALQDLKTLAPDKWIGGGLIDLHLSHRFTASQDLDYIVYIPFAFVNTTLPPTQEHIDTFSALHGTINPREHVYVFLQFAGSHYSIVTIRFSEDPFSCTWGRKHSEVTRPYVQDNWTQWHGQEVWDRVATLVGLSGDPPPPPDMRLAVQWNQVSGEPYIRYCSAEPFCTEWQRLWGTCCGGCGVPLHT